MKFAIFDLDHTLLPIDSGDAWTRAVISHAGSEREALERKAIQINQDYSAGLMDADDAVRFQLGLLKRFSRKELDAIREEFLESTVWPQIREKALDLLASRRAAGYEIILASGTHRFVTAPIAERLGIRTLLSATPEGNEKGEFTGNLVGSHSYREGKLRLIEAFLAPYFEKGPVELEGYSDSINDLPFLTYVSEKGGRTFAVNPDEKLRAHALREGWPVMELFAKEDP